MNLSTYKDLTCIYVSSKALISEANRQERIVTDAVRNGITRKNMTSLHQSMNVLYSSYDILQASISHLYPDRKAQVPRYNGWNKEFFEDIYKTIDKSLPDKGNFDEAVLDKAKMDLMITLSRSSFLAPVKKRSLSQVKKSVSDHREPQQEKQKTKTMNM